MFSRNNYKKIYSLNNKIFSISLLAIFLVACNPSGTKNLGDSCEDNNECKLGECLPESTSSSASKCHFPPGVTCSAAEGGCQSKCINLLEVKDSQGEVTREIGADCAEGDTECACEDPFAKLVIDYLSGKAEGANGGGTNGGGASCSDTPTPDGCPCSAGNQCNTGSNCTNGTCQP